MPQSRTAIESVVLHRFFSIFLLATGSLAHADEKIEYCTHRAEFAEAVLEARYRSEPIDMLLEIVERVNASDYTQERMIEIVFEAYNKPLYTSEEYIGTAVREFRNAAFLHCYEEF